MKNKGIGTVVIVLVILAIGGIGAYFLMFSDGSETNGQATETAEFEYSNLAISPLMYTMHTICRETPVRTSVTVTNVGNRSGTREVELSVEGEVVDSENVSLVIGESKTVYFDEIRKNEVGTYEVEIADLSDNFEVVASPIHIEVKNIEWIEGKKSVSEGKYAPDITIHLENPTSKDFDLGDLRLWYETVDENSPLSYCLRSTDETWQEKYDSWSVVLAANSEDTFVIDAQTPRANSPDGINIVAIRLRQEHNGGIVGKTYPEE